MSEFDNVLLNAASAISDNDIERAKRIYIEEFRKNKYDKPVQAICTLVLLNKIYKDNFEVLFHLFNHFLMIGLYEEAEFYFKILAEQYKDDLKNIIKEIKILHPMQGVFKEHIFEEKFTPVSDILKAGKKDDYAKLYYEIAFKLKSFDANLSEVYFIKAINNSNGRVKIKLTLNYAHLLVEIKDEERAFQVLKKLLYDVPEAESAPILYKLGRMHESFDNEKALTYYKSLMEVRGDYLDTEDRINHLTKREKSSKIINYDIEDDNIYF